jgi:predicted chitinase
VFESIKSNKEALDGFLANSNQRALFCAIVEAMLYSADHSAIIFGNDFCSMGHDMKTQIIRRMFNTFAKNYAKQLTETVLANKPQSSKNKNRRNVAKLTGKKA